MAQKRQLRAVLASAVVLGLGAVTTLALWSDSDTIFGTFTSTGFAVESATAPNGEFREQDGSGGTGEAVVLNFGIPFGGLTPGEPVETELWFRMATATSGEVRVLAPTVEQADLNEYLDIEVATGACSLHGQVLQSGALGQLTPSVQTLKLPPGDESGPGAVQALCIEATLRDTTDLGVGNYSTGAVEWNFHVTERVVG